MMKRFSSASPYIMYLKFVLICNLCLVPFSYAFDAESNATSSEFYDLYGLNEEDDILTEDNLKFPKGFRFGSATSAYQIEGAWNKEGKSENMWDHYLHSTPSLVKDHNNADVSCDSYDKYKEDVQLMKRVGLDTYRFSISWARLLPTGEDNVINKEGVKYYNNLINELLKHGVTPIVTLYHWDLPQQLAIIGGWTNPFVAGYFERYSRVAFRLFGDRVKHWITINEPAQVTRGYGGKDHVPVMNYHGVAEYFAGHTLLRAHAKAYHVYDKEFRHKQKGKIGISISSGYYFPRRNTKEDRQAAERILQFNTGWFAHPIFSKKGDYPPIMRALIDENSRKEGRSVSRLPKFTPKEIKLLKGSADFFALNHYSSTLVSKGKIGQNPSWDHDVDVTQIMNPHWPSSAIEWLKVAPKGFRGVLKWIKKQYNNPDVIIASSGYADNGKSLVDNERIHYFKSYLTELLKAVHIDKCNVKGYMTWSLIDNFEWFYGYTAKFGLFHVDFNDKNRKRTAKKSVKFFTRLVRDKRIPNDF